MERLITIGLPLETVDFADFANQLATANNVRTHTMIASADRAGSGLGGLLDALARVRENTALRDILGHAARELCGAGIFDRVMVSNVSGSLWSPLALYVVGTDGRVVLDLDDTGSGVEDLEIPLASPMVEAEVVRRRLPALVADAADESRVYRPLLERTRTTEYVVAPVIVDSTAIALLHADAATTGRPLTDLDRDLLRLFADGVGLAYERAQLSERARRQHRVIADACGAALNNLTGESTDARHELTLTPQALPGGESGATAVRHSGTESRRDSDRLSRLTAREHEVLALLASGATNAQLADRLTVAESTVKSHVKHILHKLGAGNRAAAIACYLRETRDGERRPR